MMDRGEVAVLGALAVACSAAGVGAGLGASKLSSPASPPTERSRPVVKSSVAPELPCVSSIDKDEEAPSGQQILADLLAAGGELSADLEALIGSPVRFPDDLHPRYGEDARRMLEELVGPDAVVARLDCDEFPCVASITYPFDREAESGPTSMDILRTLLDDPTFDLDLGLYSTAFSMTSSDTLTLTVPLVPKGTEVDDAAWVRRVMYRVENQEWDLSEEAGDGARIP